MNFNWIDPKATKSTSKGEMFLTIQTSNVIAVSAELAKKFEEFYTEKSVEEMSFYLGVDHENKLIGLKMDKGGHYSVSRKRANKAFSAKAFKDEVLKCYGIEKNLDTPAVRLKYVEEKEGVLIFTKAAE